MPAEHKRLSRWYWLLLLYPFAEVGTTVLLTSWVGATISYALYAVPAILGLLVQLRRYPRIRALCREMDARDKGLDAEARKALWREPARVADMLEVACYGLAVAMFLVPGALSHVVALVLVVPPTRRQCIGVLARKFVSYQHDAPQTPAHATTHVASD